MCRLFRIFFIIHTGMYARNSFSSCVTLSGIRSAGSELNLMLYSVLLFYFAVHYFWVDDIPTGM